MGWVVNATPRPLYPQERPGTHCIGGWVGPRAGLDGCGKSRAHRDSVPGPSCSVYLAKYYENNVWHYSINSIKRNLCWLLKKQVFVVVITCIKCVVLQLIHSTSDSRIA